MKTVLLIVLFSLANPSEPARLLHKVFDSPAACQRAFINTMAEAPIEPSVKVSAFCTKVSDLAEEPEI